MMIGMYVRVNGKSKKLRFIITAVSLMLVVAVTSAAWFFWAKKLSRTEDLTVNMPPVIYIKDDNLEQITSFRLDGLKVGEEYNAIFCVSPTVPGSVSDFFLGLIFTENFGMDINLYAVSDVTDSPGAYAEAREIGPEDNKTTCYFNYNKGSYIPCVETYGNWENTSKPTPGNLTLNNGIYKAYNNLSFSSTYPPYSDTETIKKFNDTTKYKFFILNIKWNEDWETKFENIKETDIVYIVSKGTRKANNT